MDMEELIEQIEKLGYETLSSCFYTDVFYKDNLVATLNWIECSFILHQNFYGLSKIEQDKLFHLLWECGKKGE